MNTTPRLAACFVLSALAATVSVPAGGQSPAPQPPAGPGSPEAAVIQMTGYDEARFNPTRGTVFFTLGGERAPAGPANVAITINGQPLPPGTLRMGGRVAAATLVLPAGLNRIGLTAWDEQGEIGSTEARVWAGDGALAVDVRDPQGAPVEAARVELSLASNPSVRARAETVDGRAEFFNLPREALAVQAQGPGGRSASARVPPGERRVELRLR